MMHTGNPRDCLDAAYERLRHLRTEAVQQATGESAMRRSLAQFLRCAADRLDPAPLGRWVALSSGTLVEER